MKEDTGDETDYNDPGERQDSKLSSRYGAGGGTEPYEITIQSFLSYKIAISYSSTKYMERRDDTTN